MMPTRRPSWLARHCVRSKTATLTSAPRYPWGRCVCVCVCMCCVHVRLRARGGD
jgi:hypothetical protein